MSAPTTTKRSTAKKPVEHRMGTVTGLCDTCYDVHPVRLTVTEVNTAKLKGYLTGACPVCQVANRYHSLIREVGDPHRDSDERNAEEERIARDAELTFHITELQRAGARVFPDCRLGRFALRVRRYLDDGEFTVEFDWAGEPHQNRLEMLKEAADRVAENGAASWHLYSADEASDDVPYAEMCFYKSARKDGAR